MADLKVHKSAMRGKEMKCDECQFKCTTSNKLKEHKEEMHKRKMNIICDFCDFQTDDESLLQMHFIDAHNINLYRCSSCNTILKSKDGLQNHIRMFHNSKFHQCNECDFRCKTSINLEKHKTIAHTDKCANHGNDRDVRASTFGRTYSHTERRNNGHEEIKEEIKECRYGERCNRGDCSFFHPVSSRPRKRTSQGSAFNHRTWSRAKYNNQEN